MNRESFLFKGANGQDVFTWYWSVPDKPLGVLQVIHGMAEHAERYSEFAEYLNGRGFEVYACDLRGHGRPGELNGNLCHLDKDGFSGIVEDQKILSDMIMKRRPGVPLFILGHSFGSFILQEYIKRYGNDISGVILSGSCKMDGPEIKAGLIIAMLSLPFGGRRPNKLINKLSFGRYNERIEEPESEYSWLSRDHDQVRKYDDDRFCGNVMSTGFYHCFFKGLAGLYRNVDDGKINVKLPAAILSGTCDPVGKYDKGVRKLYDWYKDIGMENVMLKLYEGARHEIINETNRREVYGDIASWLEERIDAGRH
jgi:alpha-beta hydrolase superfamily lysophospholipase